MPQQQEGLSVNTHESGDAVKRAKVAALVFRHSFSGDLCVGLCELEHGHSLVLFLVKVWILYILAVFGMISVFGAQLCVCVFTVLSPQIYTEVLSSECFDGNLRLCRFFNFSVCPL